MTKSACSTIYFIFFVVAAPFVGDAITSLLVLCSNTWRDMCHALGNKKCKENFRQNT